MAGAPLHVPAILADANGEAMFDAEAFPTHDGFYAIALPVGAGRFTVGLRWGAAFECVQIESARFFVAESFGMVSDNRSIPAPMVHDAMECVAGDLYRCAGETALSMIPPPRMKRDVDALLHIVFRPVVRRGEPVEMKQAA